MLITLLNLGIIVAVSALGAFVAARAWDHLPARLFVALCGLIVLLRVSAWLRAGAIDLAQAYGLGIATALLLCLLALSLLALTAALFVPQWLGRRGPLAWMSLPYLAALLAILLDAALGLGLLFDGVRPDSDGYTLRRAEPGGLILLVLFIVGWLPPVLALIVAAWRRPQARSSAGIIAFALVLSMITGAFEVIGALNTLPITLALGHIVLRSRLLLPTRAGIDLAVRASDEPVLILDPSDVITFANRAAAALGLRQGLRLHEALAAAGLPGADLAEPIVLGGRTLILRRDSIAGPAGEHLGTLLIARDITEIERRTRQLADERARLSQAVAQLESEQSQRAQLAATVQALALPVIPALPGVLILPLVGAFDGPRIGQFIEVLLASIERQRARVVLIDITGLPLLDTAGAQGLIYGVQSARLLGARCVLVGVRPEIAQALVTLGLTLETIQTAASLQQALQREIQNTQRAAPASPPNSYRQRSDYDRAGA